MTIDLSQVDEKKLKLAIRLIKKGVTYRDVKDCTGIGYHTINQISQTYNLGSVTDKEIGKKVPTRIEKDDLSLFCELYERIVIQKQTKSQVIKDLKIKQETLYNICEKYHIERLTDHLPVWIRKDAYPYLKKEANKIGAEYHHFINSLYLIGYVAWRGKFEKAAEERLLKRLTYKIKVLAGKKENMLIEMNNQVNLLLDWANSIGYKSKKFNQRVDNFNK